MSNLAVIENKLVLPEGEVVAHLDPRIAGAVYNSMDISGSHNCLGYSSSSQKLDFLYFPFKSEYMNGNKGIRVGEMVFGIHGAIGETHLENKHHPKITGIVHIPFYIMPMVELICSGKDNNKYRDFLSQFLTSEFPEEKANAYTQTHGMGGARLRWNLDATKSSIDAIEGVSFLPVEYHWRLVSDGDCIFDLGESDFDAILKPHTEALKEYIANLDAYLAVNNPMSQKDEIDHEFAKRRYNDIQLGNVKLLG
jgi:hypothetical protein